MSGASKKCVVFDQLAEVGPGRREKKRKEVRDGMLDQSL